MSGGSSANNSWTILTPEETAAETLRPLAEGTEPREESNTSTAEHAGGEAESRPAEGAASAEEEHQVSEEKAAELSGDTVTVTGPADHPTLTPPPVSDVPPPSTLDVPTHSVPGSDALSQSEGLPESPAQSSPDPDSFSDSYTHISPSPDDPPASLLSTETLGGVELTQEEERLAQEETLHPLNGEELEQEGEESELSQRVTDLGKQAVYLVDQLVMDLFSIWARRLSGEAVVDSPVDSEVAEEKKGEEGEPEVRRRSLLAALERIGRSEEEEEGEEEFQLPRREEDSGFSVNKCILGAVILLGLGTIFFSGVFMDLDEESDYGARELRDAEVPVKQEWLNPEVPPPPVDTDSTELLNKLVKGNQQISVLQAQLQKDELKVAKGQAAEGAKERLRREEVERENGRLKKEMASLPVLHKENERMKRELESVPALQKELETLRATVTELKLPTANEAAPSPVNPTASPPTGQAGDSRQGTAGTAERQAKKPWEGEKVEKKKEWKKEKHDMGEKKEWKEREKVEGKEGEKKERKDGGKTEWKEKEWKKGKHEEGKYDQEKRKEGKQSRQSEEKKEWKERGDWKKEKATRGDEGKPWKDREGKKEWKEKSERKERKEEKDWKKGKHEKSNDGKQWRGKEEKKERKGGKDDREWHKGKEEWKGEKEWKKGKDGYKESGKERKEKWEKNDWKEKGEKKDWKEKGEKKEWKKDGDWKSKNGKDHGKEWKGKDERKQWEKKERSKEGEWKREGPKEERNNGDWKKDRGNKHKNERKHNEYENQHEHHKEHLWQGPGDRKPPHTHRQPSLEQSDYWVHQRDRLQHKPRPPNHCDSVETCAQAEGLIPVPLPEFEAILQGYLAKAEGAGVDASKREELGKLATEFFKDGVFVHDQMSFQDFVEDVGDILEDMVEGDEDGGGEEDEAIEEEMDGFEREVMDKFSVPGAGERAEERKKGEWRKESGRGRG
uniref:pre-B-cell leukemia homeobox interacting protein 1b isoform X2 n=1 Tax=Centroberyx gerrardi TaxID=166262 RepID=UPI003AAC6269